MQIYTDSVIIGFEADELNLLHTLSFASLPPSKPLRLTLQNISEESVFFGRGSEERQRILVPKEEVPKYKKDQLLICHKKSKST